MCNVHIFQKIKGFETISLSNSVSLTADSTVPYIGKACEWIDLNKVTIILGQKNTFIYPLPQLRNNVGCGNGDKMVIKNSKGVSLH